MYLIESLRYALEPESSILSRCISPRVAYKNERPTIFFLGTLIQLATDQFRRFPQVPNHEEHTKVLGKDGSIFYLSQYR